MGCDGAALLSTFTRCADSMPLNMPTHEGSVFSRHAWEAAQESGQDLPIIAASMPATPTHRKLALIVVLVLAGVAVLLLPFAGKPAARIDVYIPVIQTVMCVADLITAVLLFSEYSVERRPAILVLASGYIASGSFAFLQTLAFPGGYGPNGAIGDGLNTPAWIFVLWHTTFPLAVAIYALKKDAAPEESPRRSAIVPIAITIACVATAIAALAWIVAAWPSHLPIMYATSVTQQTSFARNINIVLWLCGFVALLILFARRKTILDLWLMVTLIAWMPNFLVAVFVTGVRFSVGWYAARGYALVASCTLLTVLLISSIQLQARIATTNVLLRRERANRLMSVDAATSAMAHEIRQPLTGIVTSCSAALSWLSSNPPNLEQARTMIASAASAGRRANEIVTGVRKLFRRETGNRDAVDLDDLTLQVLALLRDDLRGKQVSLTTALQGDLPRIHVDRTQVQQAILILVQNAVDAMASIHPDARRLKLTTELSRERSVTLSIQDSGPGIATENSNRVFDAFFTTKSAGMGLGLSICQTIIEDHGGSLRLAKTGPDGTTFEILFPVVS